MIKVTRHGVFGFSPGIELALVASSQDARRFHLWEASPLEYLERLHLQNFLVPGLNTLEGIIVQPGDEMSIVTSQPRFEIIPVTTVEIDAWFTSFGFGKITDSAYYRPDDNLGIFDAHDKNVVRAGDLLVPFDVNSEQFPLLSTALRGRAPQRASTCAGNQRPGMRTERHILAAQEPLAVHEFQNGQHTVVNRLHQS